MKHIFIKLFLVLILFNLYGCTEISQPTQTLSISGVIEFPLPVNSSRYWVDDGPLFVLSRDPLITYRVIDQKEIEFAGSEKSVYDFLESSLTKPKGIAEESFFNSQKEYELNKSNKHGITFYILSKTNESKVYVISESMNIGIEVLATGKNASSIINDVIDKTRLTSGG